MKQELEMMRDFFRIEPELRKEIDRISEQMVKEREAKAKQTSSPN